MELDLATVQKTGQWAYGLCGCFNNWNICCVAYCLPCITFGQTAQALGRNCVTQGLLFAVPILNCFLAVKQRAEIRQLRDIPGTTLIDCCLVSWLIMCTIVQEAQEVELMKAEYIASRPLPVVVTQGGVPGAMVMQETQPATLSVTDVTVTPDSKAVYPEKSEEMERI